MVELCQVREHVGTSSQEMVQAFGKLREVYGPSIDRDPHLDDVSMFNKPLLLENVSQYVPTPC